LNSTRYGFSLLSALVAAVVGGAVWAGFAIITNYELSLIAWAIGGLAAYAVFYSANKQITQAHRVIAVIASLLGILLGKYFLFGYYVTNSVSGIFDSPNVTLFQENISQLFSATDILFVLLAMYTAWQLPARLALRAAAQAHQQAGPVYESSSAQPPVSMPVQPSAQEPHKPIHVEEIR
jgi:hypothetical protein